MAATSAAVGGWRWPAVPQVEQSALSSGRSTSRPSLSIECWPGRGSGRRGLPHTVHRPAGSIMRGSVAEGVRSAFADDGGGGSGGPSMFRRVSDFQKIWAHESEATLKMLKGLSDASLSQSVGPDGRTLGRLAWHLTGTIPEMMSRTGLKVT